MVEQRFPDRMHGRLRRDGERYQWLNRAQALKDNSDVVLKSSLPQPESLHDEGEIQAPPRRGRGPNHVILVSVSKHMNSSANCLHLQTSNGGYPVLEYIGCTTPLRLNTCRFAHYEHTCLREHYYKSR